MAAAYMAFAAATATAAPSTTGAGDATDGKSPLLAFALPVGATAAGAVMLYVADQQEFGDMGASRTAWHALGWAGVAAFVAGPSLGRIYAGDWWNSGLIVRALGVGAMSLGGYIDRDAPAPGNGYALMLLGGLLYVGGGLYEIGSAPVVAYRRGHRDTTDLHVGVSPMRAGRGVVPSVGLSGRF